MSMLSAQCDELRWLADNLEEHDSHMDEYVQAMRSAADTIWELRNDCVELRDENAKLSNQLTDVTESMGRVEERCANLRAERDEWHRVAVSKQDIIDHMRDARGENVKLRELLLDCWDFSHLMHGAMAARFYELGLIGDGEARELGIEVTP